MVYIELKSNCNLSQEKTLNASIDQRYLHCGLLRRTEQHGYSIIRVTFYVNNLTVSLIDHLFQYLHH